jgi:hypothetical protein
VKPSSQTVPHWFAFCTCAKCCDIAQWEAPGVAEHLHAAAVGPAISESNIAVLQAGGLAVGALRLAAQRDAAVSSDSEGEQVPKPS